MKPVYVPKNPHEKAMQRALIQYRNPKNHELVLEALKKAGRMDLVGFDRHCLIRPRHSGSDKATKPGNGPNRQENRTARKKKTIRNVHKKKKTR